MSKTEPPAKVASNDRLGPLPTSAEDDAVVQARLSKTPAEAYERGYLDGAAGERERCAKVCDHLADDEEFGHMYATGSAECARLIRG